MISEQSPGMDKTGKSTNQAELKERPSKTERSDDEKRQPTSKKTMIKEPTLSDRETDEDNEDPKPDVIKVHKKLYKKEQKQHEK